IPAADFSAAPTSGPAPLTVQFTDASAGSPTSWAWDFQNDGTVDSTAQSPQFVYQSAGTYSVALTATNASGSNTKTRTAYVSVGPPLSPLTFAPTDDARVKSLEPTTN